MFIFDDPLSALDPAVAETVFEECILGMLGGKTRIVVTNQLQFLGRCDSIVALGKHGTVLEQGTYDDLLNDSDGEVTRLLKGINPTRRSSRHSVDATTSEKEETKAPKENKKLMTKEERQTGTVKLEVYLQYIKAGGGYLAFTGVFFVYLFSTGTNVLTSVWVSVWTADSAYKNRSE